MGKTGIQWTEVTWNPVTGCSKVSQGCKFCYAERLWKRVYPYRAFTDVRLHPERLAQPSRWHKPRRIFVNSMSDLFHESLSFAQVKDVFAAMFQVPHHTYQILTKRPERMGAVVKEICEEARIKALPPHFWMGVSVENQAALDERLPLLIRTPARMRWISAEPLLESVDFGFLGTCPKDWNRGYTPVGEHIRWVVVGGESGYPKQARPFCLSWARDIIRQCREAQIPVFIKQLGSHPVNDLEPLVYGQKAEYRLQDSHGGDPQEWAEELRVREYPQ